MFKAFEPSEWGSAKGCARREDRQGLAYLRLIDGLFGAVASYPVNRLRIMRQANTPGKSGEIVIVGSAEPYEGEQRSYNCKRQRHGSCPGDRRGKKISNHTHD